jgi:hypothetical protein
MILSDAVMDWLESFLVREGLSSSTAEEFRTVLFRALITRAAGDTENDPFVDFFIEHQKEMDEWQVHFFSDVAWIMYQIGRIHQDNYNQKLIELRRTLILIFERSFKLKHAKLMAFLVMDIGKSTSSESEALARKRLVELLHQERLPGSQLYGTKQVIELTTELARVIAREKTELIDPEQ